MPAIQPSKSNLILVTGGSGYIASHVVLRLLQEGFSVRTTVRSADKGEYLAKLFGDKGFSNEFSYLVVEDIETEGAHDEAVKGVVGIAHTASPFHFKVTDVHKDLINPAVKGTQGLLKSAHEHAKDVKRVVITSSFAAIVEPKPGKEPYVFTEEDWNTFSPKQIEEKGNATPAMEAYRASKTLAERSAWDFVDQNKPSFDIATVNPPFVFGPIIHQVPSRDKLNTSVAIFDAFVNGEKSEKDLITYVGNWIDVRDVAEVHVQALIQEHAGGQRWGPSVGPIYWQDVVDPLFDLPIPPKKVPRGVKGAGRELAKTAPVFNGSKVETKLGIKYRSLTTCTVDMYNSVLEYADKIWK